jgi:hypothetical protein
MSFTNSGFNNGSNSMSLARHISEFIGKTVTIFTTSGGISGSGFTGVVLSVNSNFVRLITEQGSGPSSPFPESSGSDLEGKNRNLPFDSLGSMGVQRNNKQRFGSICDIPIANIAAFCHNTI